MMLYCKNFKEIEKKKLNIKPLSASLAQELNLYDPFKKEINYYE